MAFLSLVPFMESTKLSFYEQRTIKWDDSKNSVLMIDQTLLPNKLSFVECRDVSSLIEAIKTMKIRGAPAIGVAGAMGVALSVNSAKTFSKKELLRKIEPDILALKSARPTAVNLAWGVDSIVQYLDNVLPDVFEGERIAAKKAIEFVKQLADNDVVTNRKLSGYGESLFQSGESVLTHCNWITGVSKTHLDSADCRCARNRWIWYSLGSSSVGN
jgi:methylthioribose-1-phosphate isomerase